MPAPVYSEERLNKPTAASALLNRHDGDPAHDPIARMNAAPIFPNLTAPHSQRGDSLLPAVQRQILTEHVRTNALMEKMIQSVQNLPSVFSFA